MSMDQAIEYALWLPQVPYDRDRAEIGTGTGTLSLPPGSRTRLTNL
ncbi:MAG: hypothetical protein ACJ78Q_07000 [Chloroflexia bacterium]